MKSEEFIKLTVTNILQKLGEEACEISVTFDIDRKIINVLITGENLGHLIGSRGEVSLALQEITNLICKKQIKCEYPVLFDIGGYKKVREEKLIKFAKEVAEKTLESDHPYKLRPMNSYERRIIHMEIAKYPKLVSYSIGEDKDRRVIVEKSEL